MVATRTPDLDVKREDDLGRINSELIEAFGRFFERFGFKRNFGRVWMLLYMSTEALDQQTIGERLDLSAGLVSSTLNQLEHWGAVRSRTGGRRKQYEAEDKLLRTVVSILKKREVPAVRRIFDVVSRALNQLEEHPNAGESVQIRRLQNIQKVARLYQVLVGFVERLSRAPAAMVRRGMALISRFAD